MNYTNPGAVSHNEILQMYKDFIDPDFTWSNFSVEEQAKVIVAARSNNLLDTKQVSHVFRVLRGRAIVWPRLFLFAFAACPFCSMFDVANKVTMPA